MPIVTIFKVKKNQLREVEKSRSRLEHLNKDHVNSVFQSSIYPNLCMQREQSHPEMGNNLETA